MSLEDALQAHEEQVDTLLRSANKYVGALKAWKKAAQIGHIGNLQKAAAQAEDLGGALPEATSDAKSSWSFDLRGYLEGDAWRNELQTVAANRYALRTQDDDDTLIASPVTVRALPGRGMLQIGRVNWPAIRPRVAAEELKRLRDRTAAANSLEFAESLLGACKHLDTSDKPFARFRDIYDLFCLTPGYKKDNPPAAFGQQIYALHKAEIRATRGGRTFEIEYATGNAKERDIFTIISEEGRTLRYYSIWFK